MVDTLRFEDCVWEGVKVCPSCDEVKPFSEFSKSRNRPNGLQSYCKPCHRARMKASRQKDPEPSREASRRWRQNHPDIQRYSRDHQRKKRMADLGMTQGDYDRMLAEQGGGCAICGAEKADDRGHRLHIDHDHDTGRVRGLLCSNCNIAIGRLQDDPGLLRRAADYLEDPRG